LLGYLKALGILRAVSRQADGAARGRWRNGRFELRSKLDREALVGFFETEYAPAPVVSPWNGGSGFHPPDRKDAIERIEASDDPRFAPLKDAISTARAVLADLGVEDKPPPDRKPALIRALRRRLSDDALAWLDAAVVVVGRDVRCPPLLGSGGNDGRFDIANNYAQAVVACLVTDTLESSRARLVASLDGGAVELQRKLSLGHFSRDSSPTNSPQGESGSLGNPWDLALAVEGALVVAGGAARRLGAAARSGLVAPFAVRATSAGYGSAAASETGSAELWLPVWPGWAGEREIALLMREAHAEVRSGEGRRPAATGLDFARAAGELGVARGISAFDRYAILERAGRSSLAVPAGRISVATRPAAAALSSIDRWLARVVRLGRADRCPQSLRSVCHRLEQGAFQLAARGSADDARAMLEALGAAEHALARSAHRIDGSGIRPLSGVPAGPWIEAVDDGSPELAVAIAIGSLRDREQRGPALRDYLNGTAGQGTAFDASRRNAVTGGDGGPTALLSAIHAARHLDAARANVSADATGLGFAFGAWCDIHAARLLAQGRLDADRVLRLVRGLALLDHRRIPRRASSAGGAARPCPAFDLLALAWRRPRPGWALRLDKGASPSVVRDAVLRLSTAGATPIVSAEDLLIGVSAGDRVTAGRRLAAALLVPLHPRDLRAVEHAYRAREEHIPTQETA
jgi:CRISPR-associated protein Csx17